MSNQHVLHLSESFGAMDGSVIGQWHLIKPTPDVYVMTSLGHPTFDSRQCQINARQPEKEKVHGITLVFQSPNQS
jgi:hypothetical protein